MWVFQCGDSLEYLKYHRGDSGGQLGTQRLWCSKVTTEERLNFFQSSSQSCFTSGFQHCRRVRTPVYFVNSLLCKIGNCVLVGFWKNFLRIIPVSQPYLIFCSSFKRSLWRTIEMDGTTPHLCLISVREIPWEKHLWGWSSASIFISPELRAALSAGKMCSRTSMVLASQRLFLVLRLGTWTGRCREWGSPLVNQETMKSRCLSYLLSLSPLSIFSWPLAFFCSHPWFFLLLLT